MASKKRGGRKTTKRGRDAKTGLFIPLKEARKRKNTAIEESVPLPGHGDTGRSKKGKGKKKR